MSVGHVSVRSKIPVRCTDNEIKVNKNIGFSVIRVINENSKLKNPVDYEVKRNKKFSELIFDKKNMTKAQYNDYLQKNKLKFSTFESEGDKIIKSLIECF